MKTPKTTLKKRVASSNKKQTVEKELAVWKYKYWHTNERILKDMIVEVKKKKQPIMAIFYEREFVVYPGYTISSALKKFKTFFYDRSFDGTKK